MATYVSIALTLLSLTLTSNRPKKSNKLHSCTPQFKESARNIFLPMTNMQIFRSNEWETNLTFAMNVVANTN